MPGATLGLVHLRASQINGCSFCVDSGSKHAKQAGETDERLFAVAAWREAPYFTDAERAALALAEAVTRLGDREDPVPDEDLEGRGPALRRAGARGADPVDCHHQRVQPTERNHQAARRLLGVLDTSATAPVVAGDEGKTAQLAKGLLACLRAVARAYVWPVNKPTAEEAGRVGDQVLCVGEG